MTAEPPKPRRVVRLDEDLCVVFDDGSFTALDHVENNYWMAGDLNVLLGVIVAQVIVNPDMNGEGEEHVVPYYPSGFAPLDALNARMARRAAGCASDCPKPLDHRDGCYDV